MQYIYSNWYEKNSGVNKNLNSVQLLENNIGWIVGDDGTILKSTNNGELWIDVNIGLSENYNSVFFINSSTGWITGDNGIILKTSDGGSTWSTQNSNLTNNILKIQFCNTDTGFALAQGGIVLKSVNGGNVWSMVFDHPSYEMNDFKFFNTAIGWMCGQGNIYRTDDGGFNWARQFNSPYIDLRSLCIIDSSIVFSVGDDGVILLTTNGGVGNPVPVELTSFTIYSERDEVILNWSTATEINNHIFEIQRKTENQEFHTLGYQEGHGTTTEPQYYTFVDQNVERNTYFYRLKQIDFLGNYQYSDEVEVFVNGVLTFTLAQNYPNPFNPNISDL